MTTPFPNATPKTEAAWIEWLADAERLLKEEYLRRPKRLIADYRTERGITHGYQGREILEMLQNAGDAAEKAGIRGRIRIELCRHGVLVANTGQGFDDGGVDSLQTANLSPKFLERRKLGTLIGNKGLGFRAILNWTVTPLISSGSLRLAYLPDHSRAVLDELKKESLELSRMVEEEAAHGDSCILPNLAFPQFIHDWDGGNWAGNPGIKVVADRCGELRRSGFDTVIGMPFSRDDAYETAKEQLEELRPEILLFVNSLGEIDIHIDGEEQPRSWSKPDSASGEITEILENGKPLGVWRVFHWDDAIPEDHRDTDDSDSSHYQISIAVPLDEGKRSNPLFSFFPMEVELPLPVVCNASLRLEENRKHPTQGKANRYILEQLAERIAEAAERFLGEYPENPWFGCELVCASGNWPVELKRVGFHNQLMCAARGKKLVPTLGGSVLVASSARLVPGWATDWLAARHFSEVATMQEPTHRRFYEDLRLEKLADKEIGQRLIDAEDLTLEERALAVAGMVLCNVDKNACSSALLLDSARETVPSDSRVILQAPANLPKLPPWGKLRFLDPELREILGTILNAGEGRDLQIKLKSFGVIEYSLASLVSAIAAEANRLIHETPAVEDQRRTDLIAFLWTLYSGYENDDLRPSFPTEPSIKLLNQAGKYDAPKNLYLATGYGPDGAVMQELYGAWAPEKLVADPKTIGIEVSETEAAGFLSWLGVARWPREKQLVSAPSEYVAHLVTNIRFPAKFDDLHIEAPENLNRAHVDNAKTLDGLDEILQTAEPTAILAWLIQDDRSDGWSRPSGKHGRLAERPFYASKTRHWNGEIRSFIHWRIANTKWLPVSGGEHACPADCLLGEKVIETLFPRPAEPPAELCQRLGLKTSSLRTAFERAGVLPGLSHLERDTIYSLLLKMPEKSEDGMAAKALSRWLLEHGAFLYGSEGENYRRFLAEGKMWGLSPEGVGYFPISELRHLDGDGFPDGLIRQLTLIDLPRRVGAEKVMRLFGVQGVERTGIYQKVVSIRKTPSWERHAERLEAVKPFIKRLRQSQTAQAQYLRSLDDLQLIVCDDLVAKVAYEQTEYEYQVGAWDWLLVEKSLYVRCNLRGEVSLDLLSDAVGAAIASLFRITEGDGFAKMFRCAESSRDQLLRRMCGEDVPVDPDAAQKSIKSGSVWAGPINPPAPAVPPISKTGDSGGDPEPIGDEVDLTKANPSTPPTEPTPVVTQLEHVPLPPSVPRKVSVRSIEGSPPSGRTQRNVTDGGLCEKMALEFEVSDTPPRFPLSVGHITGFEAPGCDILSFETQEALDVFLNPASRDLETVCRFIEVKGRGHATAKIELKGNELSAARQYADRYFLYRFFKDGDDGYEITVLKDPLQQEDAISTAVHVDLDRAQASKRYHLIPGDLGDPVKNMSQIPIPEALSPEVDV